MFSESRGGQHGLSNQFISWSSDESRSSSKSYKSDHTFRRTLVKSTDFNYEHVEQVDTEEAPDSRAMNSLSYFDLYI